MSKTFIKVGKFSALVLLLAVGIMFAARSTPVSAATFEVTNTNDAGAGSLRQAITDATSNPGLDTITFNIPGAGPHTITPSEAFPTFGGVTIDGCSQPGSDCSGLPLDLRIRINGANTDINAPGASGVLNLSAGAATTIRGLSITDGPIPAVRGQRTAVPPIFTHPNDVTLEYNYIGLAPDGTAAVNAGGFVPYSTNGVPGGNRNRVANNVFSGGGASTLPFNFFGTTDTVEDVVIENNLFGLDPTGTQPRPGGGIQMYMTLNSRITGNTIANSTGNAIDVRGRSENLLIEGNTVTNSGTQGINFTTGSGTSAAFIGPVNVYNNTITDNTTHGISTTNASDIRVGGTAAGQANTITDNGGNGVTVGANTSDISARNTIRGNTIFNNTGLGIDLANDGWTTNAPAGTVRTGPNTLLNYPTLSDVMTGSIFVEGAYDGPASGTFIMDFYMSPSADPSGSGEGQTWIGSAEVTTDASGQAVFAGPVTITNAATDIDPTTATLNGSVTDWMHSFAGTLPAGWVVSATATDADGNTSEFDGPLTSSGALDFTGYDVSFQYRLAGSSDPFTQTASQPLSGPLETFNQPLAGLSPGTTYEYQMVITWDGGSQQVLGDTVTFTTPSSASEGPADGSGDLASTGLNILLPITASGLLITTGLSVMFRHKILSAIRG